MLMCCMHGQAVALLASCVARPLGTPVLRSASPADPSVALPTRPCLAGLRVRAARAAPPAPQPRQQASEDQRVVMQALTSLLPAQQDAAGWAELATYVRHSSGGAAGRARAGSAGGVQLLSRLVAAAASRFPAEAEAAGLTERPLGPPPSMAVTAAPSMTATAAASPVGTPVGGVPAAAAAAAATMAAASGAAAAAAAERQRAEQSAAQQPTAQQPAVQIGFEMPGVTFVAETPAAAAALQQELGGSVRVVAAGQEAEEEEEAERAQWQLARRPMLLTVVVPGRDLPGELQMAQLPLGVNMVSEEDYTAAFEEQVRSRRVAGGTWETVGWGEHGVW